MSAPPGDLRVGIVGFGWMGQVHARALSRLRQHYPDAPLRPVVVAVADTADVADLAAAYGIGEVYADWRDLLARDDLDLVCVTGPNSVHRDVAVAAASSGRHVWVEKPAGRSLAETREIADAVRRAGVQSAVGFNYRNAPAVEHARDLVASGRLGRVEHTNVVFRADYAADPDAPGGWRFLRGLSGSGVLGDLASHATDLVRHVVGEIDSLVADTATFVEPRENDDHVAALLRLADGSRGTLEASRVAVGDQCAYAIEVHGTHGALAWDFRRMGELRVCLDQGFRDATWATLTVSPGVGEFGAFQPATGTAMGYDDLKVIEAHRLVESVAAGKPVGATIHDALVAAAVAEAIEESTRTRGWVSVSTSLGGS